MIRVNGRRRKIYLRMDLRTSFRREGSVWPEELIATAAADTTAAPTRSRRRSRVARTGGSTRAGTTSRTSLSTGKSGEIRKEVLKMGE